MKILLIHYIKYKSPIKEKNATKLQQSDVKTKYHIISTLKIEFNIKGPLFLRIIGHYILFIKC